MTDDEFAKARVLAEEQHKQLVRIIAPQLGVNAEALLLKAERFPVSPDPGQLQACLNEIEARGEDFTEAEHTVLLLAHKAMVEMLQSAIQHKFHDLPEFRDPPTPSE